jgi:hypothetical protein
MKKILPIILIVLSPGCVNVRYTGPDGAKFSRYAFGNKLDIGHVSVDVTGTNGIHKTLVIEGYKSDQVQGLQIFMDGAAGVTKAAVAGAVQGVK